MKMTAGEARMGVCPSVRWSNGRHICFFKTFAAWSVSWKECLLTIPVVRTLEERHPPLRHFLGKQQVWLAVQLSAKHSRP